MTSLTLASSSFFNRLVSCAIMPEACYNNYSSKLYAPSAHIKGLTRLSRNHIVASVLITISLQVHSQQICECLVLLNFLLFSSLLPSSLVSKACVRSTSYLSYSPYSQRSHSLKQNRQGFCTLRK